DRRAPGQRSKLRSVSVQGELAERIDQGRLAAGGRLPSETQPAPRVGGSPAPPPAAPPAPGGGGGVRPGCAGGAGGGGRERGAHSLDLNFGVSDAIRAAGMQAGTKQGRHWIGPASASEAERLGLEPGRDVLVIERVRTADGRPVVFSRDIMPGGIIGDRADVA